ncbi:MAG: PEP-CTERM sorting domain-containing protein [Nitrospirae bacterium]|nr:PEP-CTERM sorting domain-containing protein [Nitrospirota bacterium]
MKMSFARLLAVSTFVLVAAAGPWGTEAFATHQPGHNPPGNGIETAPGQNNNNTVTRLNGSVSVPGTLLLFGAGFAGFAAWRWRKNRHNKD